MSTVTVVIPSLNDADMLRQCLRDLAAQTRAPDEILVVDNGSTDDTVAVARDAGARVITEPRRGVLHATSAGFDAAGGTIIGRLDADSRPAPDWVARIAASLDADPALAAVTGTGEFYGGGPIRRFVGRRLYLGAFFIFVRLFAAHEPVFGSNFALRRDVWLQIRDRLHRDDPRIHDDLDISFALTPEMRVRNDRDLRVGVSARPFDNVGAVWRRISWAFHNIGVCWRDVSWWERHRRARRFRERAGIR